MPIQTIQWLGDSLRLIDQTRLPTELVYIDCRDVEAVAEAIEQLRVRGAPAIGVTAAYGVVIGALTSPSDRYDEFIACVRWSIERLGKTRPTAVNLFWALGRMNSVLDRTMGLDPPEIRQELLNEAHSICKEDRIVCRQIGRNGAELLQDGMTVLTHCNAGGLATTDYGTALAIIYAAAEQGKRIRVFADETRPLLQGARLTAWELMQNGIDVTVICDSMAATVMKRGMVECIIVGADRVARNGDTANKIGTYGLAVLAKEHRLPFYVAAPVSTLDLSTETGEEIPIEERRPEEITNGLGRQITPFGVKVFNPAFDVTPHEFISAIISERGIARPPYLPVLESWVCKQGT